VNVTASENGILRRQIDELKNSLQHVERINSRMKAEVEELEAENKRLKASVQEEVQEVGASHEVVAG